MFFVLFQLIIAADDFQEALKTTKPSLHQTDIDQYAWMYVFVILLFFSAIIVGDPTNAF